MVIKGIKVREYLDPRGRSPYRERLESLPSATVLRIQARILRIEGGNLGDFMAVGHGVHEIRLDFGPGFRVYFGFDGKDLVILVAGGDKASQRRDILQARRNWIDYLYRK